MDKKMNFEIGDYVTFGSEVHKVLTIDSDGVVFLDGCDDLIPVGLMEPIPITPEILEKNGFYEHDGYYTSEFFNLHHRINNTYAIGDTMMRVTYVHELQHALRLCGIKKDIEL